MLPIYCREAARLPSISQIAINDTVKYAGLDYAAAAGHFQQITDRASLNEFAERYRLPKRFILTVGRVYHTGHDRLDEYPGGNNERLIRGYRKYGDADGNLPLVVAGRHIDKYLRARGLDGAGLQDVHFTGFIPNQEIVKACNLAEFFVLARLYESFSLPLIEAMACGCPAMVPSAGGFPDLAQAAARLIDPLDEGSIAPGMLELERAPEQPERMRAAGLNRAAEFSWRRTAEVTRQGLDAARPPVSREVRSGAGA